MREWQNQSHVRWYCRYHIVIVPTYRQKAIFGTLRKDIGKILRELCHQMGIELVEGHAMPDHVHLCLSMPPKYSVANAIGRLKGKSAIRIHREYLGRVRNFTGLHFWARGYCVSTVGLDEAVIRQSIRNQEQQEQRAEQLALGDLSTRRSRSAHALAGPGAWKPPAGASDNSALGEGFLQRRPPRGPPITGPSSEGHIQQCPRRGHATTVPPFRGASSNHPLCGW